MPTLLFQHRHELDVRREQELIHGDHARDAVAAIDKYAQVPRASSRIAGDHDHLRHLRTGQRLGLRLGARPWRVEHHGVVAGKLPRGERNAEEIARVRPHRLQLRRCPRRSRQGSDGLLVLFEGIDLGACSEREGEGADAGEQIGDPLRAADALFDEP